MNPFSNFLIIVWVIMGPKKDKHVILRHIVCFSTKVVIGSPGLKNSINLLWRWHSRRELIQRYIFFGNLIKFEKPVNQSSPLLARCVGRGVIPVSLLSC